MSKYFSDKQSALEAYVPGEQPQDRQYVKLNTNESPFPPSPYAERLSRQAAGNLNLYCDPECGTLAAVAAEYYGVSKEQMIFTNGSDEVLNFAFLAFCDDKTPAVFPDISYGFYPVFARVNGVPYREIPLGEDFTVNSRDYFGAKGTIFLANPNAPTGIALGEKEIEEILKANPDNVVVIDEAYVDFGGETALPLIGKYDNLLVTRTFSKSYSLAGGRLGIGFGSPDLIADLRKIKYSTNPYNVNSMTSAMGIGILSDEVYTKDNCMTIIENRDYTVDALKKLDFQVLPSCANFIFVSSDQLEGGKLYKRLKDKGVLVRHFTKERISNWCRVSIGSRKNMEFFIEKVTEILAEAGDEEGT